MMETNTFSPMRTGIQTFADDVLWRPGDVPGENLGIFAPLLAAMQQRAQDSWEIIRGTVAFCQPRGVIFRESYETLRDEILDQIRSAMPLDIVALNLHGSMVADGYTDCEADIATKVREIIGPDATFGIELDSHCNITEEIVEAADAIVIFKEYPHTDFEECAGQLADILIGKAEGKLNPEMSLVDCDMIDMFYTTSEPMKGFVERMRELERSGEVLSVSAAHGFPWSDVPEMGTKMLVVTDGDKAKAHALAQQLAGELYALRGQTAGDTLSRSEGLKKATESSKRPVVLADIADNPGGGAPGDSTFLLQALLSGGVEQACLATFWDPIVVQLCFEAGEGVFLDLRLGGKMGPTSGDPLDVRAEVLSLKKDHTQAAFGVTADVGDSALIRVDGVEIVVTSRRNQAFHPGIFTDIGVDLSSKNIIVVKSIHHFYEGFAPLAASILYVDSGGALASDVTKLNYNNIKRPKWPFDKALLKQ